MPSRSGPGEIRRDPGRTRPPLPDFRPAPAPDLEIPTPPEAPERRLSTGAEVLVNQLRLRGNTVFSDAELAEITAPYMGRTIRTGELLDLRDALTRYYVERGYINSGATIPDQTVEGGIIDVAIVEGVLEEIVITGLESLRPEFVEERIRLSAGPAAQRRRSARAHPAVADRSGDRSGQRPSRPGAAAGCRPARVRGHRGAALPEHPSDQQQPGSERRRRGWRADHQLRQSVREKRPASASGWSFPKACASSRSTTRCRSPRVISACSSPPSTSTARSWKTRSTRSTSRARARRSRSA